MRFLPRRFAAVLAGVALAATVSVFAVVPALADGSGVTATLTGGSLSESTSAAPSVSVTLNGTDQVKSYTVPITVTDATGSGDGWELTITSTTFATEGATHSFATDATTITGVTAVCTEGNTCTDPDNSITYSSFTVPAGTSAPDPVVFYNAAADSGLGSFTVTPTMYLAVPANMYAGSYSSTITLSIDNGPA